MEARRHAADDQGRALHDGGHAALGDRDRCEDRAKLIWTHSLREGQRAAGVAAASCPDTACRIGPTGAAMTASSTVTTGYQLVALNAKTGR
jgi:hypothetical protein